MKKNLIIPILAGIALSGCSLWPQKAATTITPTSTVPTPSVVSTPVSTESAVTEEGQVTQVTVEGSEFKFTPKVINVKAGDKVRVTFKNTGKMMHDFRLEEFSASTPVISGGKEAVVEFVAEKVGAFEFYCSVGNHRQMGMVGTLNVR